MCIRDRYQRRVRGRRAKNVVMASTQNTARPAMVPLPVPQTPMKHISYAEGQAFSAQVKRWPQGLYGLGTATSRFESRDRCLKAQSSQTALKGVQTSFGAQRRLLPRGIPDQPNPSPPRWPLPGSSTAKSKRVAKRLPNFYSSSTSLRPPSTSFGRGARPALSFHARLF
eukprot:TRINITY_DN1435_c0_g1_i2.p1 TRINITY_DN1435_c0_g1~~TRINITY_DN1435_c0_g1_i2.p1  ORF type:complete len:169 (-),score=23.72 TRINITY_DN1435_c0_g1_i2:236-742(-)